MNTPIDLVEINGDLFNKAVERLNRINEKADGSPEWRFEMTSATIAIGQSHSDRWVIGQIQTAIEASGT